MTLMRRCCLIVAGSGVSAGCKYLPMLNKRIITALCGIPLVSLIVWFGTPWFTILVAGWGVLALFEFYRMAANTEIVPFTYFGLVWALLLIISPHYGNASITPFLSTSAIVLSLIWLLLRPRREGAFVDWAWTIGGILYIGWMLSYFVALRGLPDGRNWVFLALLATFGSDILAFFVGKLLGRHRLAPNISPAKTWEGAVGGVLGSILVSLFFVLPTPLELPLSYGQAIVLGLLVSVFGQLGDLVESLLKRNMQVKDSGNAIPGHGGFLDRIDSVIFAGVVVYYYIMFFVL